ncbi:MAG: prepilin peptidase [Muribaculaceae bacterium]|nr:prepilin peptidase [Muribaculaceae bacterium]
MSLSLVILGFIFIVGLCIGSFLNVVILRTVSEESIVFPASKCPKCQNPLKWYHNIPVLSYLFLKGKCAFCKEHISIQYPIVELLTGILFVALFLKICNPFDFEFGLSFLNPVSLSQIIVYVFLLIVSGLFIAIAGTDILEKKVADAHVIPLIVLGVLYSVVYSAVSFIAYTKEYGFPAFSWDFITSCPVVYSLAAAILGFLIMEAVSRLGLVTVGARAFGEGDSYIAAGIGAVFGALFSSTALYKSVPMTVDNFYPIFKILVATLILSGIIQIVITLPLFIKKLIDNKNWVTLGSVSVFIIYTISYLFAQQLNWLINPVAYWASTIVLLAIGLFTCRELLCGLKENRAADALYLPFGPAMIIASLIVIFVL